MTIIAQQIEVGYNSLCGAVAHRSEQAAHNHLVDSSTLSSPTIELMIIKRTPFGALFVTIRA